MNIKSIITMTALLAIMSSPAYADRINGKVVDSTTMNPIEGVSVILKNAENIPVSYTFSDSEGTFTLPIPPSGTKNTILEARMIGFKSHSIRPPFDDFLDIKLAEDIIALNETVFYAEQVKQTGDTTTYFIPTLVSNDDRILGDVLKKLPGVSVDEKGLVKVYGQPINKFYIEGVDLLEGRYNIATNNISPQDVKEVKIYERHQPIRALEGIKESDNAAMNIILKDNARDKWLGTLQAEAGGSTEKPWVPYSASGMAMNISKVFQTINTLKTDAAGNDISVGLNGTGLSTDWSNVDFNDRYSPETFTGISHQSAPLSTERTRFNTSYSATTNNKFSVGKRKNLTIGISGIFEHETLDSYNSAEETYWFDDGTSERFREINDTHTGNFLGYGNITAELNMKKLYLRDNFQVEFSGSSAGNNLKGTESRNEQADIDGLNILNYFRFFIRKSDKSGFGLQMFTQYARQAENMSIHSPDDDVNSIQNIHGEYFYNNIQYNYSYTPSSWFKLNSQTNLKYMRRHLTSSLDGLNLGLQPEDYLNDAMLQYLQPVENISFNFNVKRFNAYVYLNAWYQYIDYRLISNSNGRHTFAVNPSVRLEYDFGPRLTIRANAGYSMSAIDEQQIFTGLIMQNYKYLTKGRTELEQLPGYNVNMELEFRAPMSGWFIKGSGTYHGGSDFELSRYFINDEYIVNVLSNNVSGYSSGRVNVEISKAFLKIGGKLTGNFEFSRTSSTISQNSIQNEYTGDTYSAGIKYYGGITRWLGVEYDGNYEYSTYYMTEEESGNADANHTTFHNITVTLLPCDKFEIDMSCEFYFNKYGSGTHFSAIFLNVSAWYRINSRIQVYIHARNLTDQHTFAYTYLLPMQTTHYEYRIRPLNVLLGVQVKF